MRYLLAIMILTLSLSSCYVNRTTVGNGPVGKSSAVKYSHKKQVYLFWGAIGLGSPQPATPKDCGYQVKTAFNGWDILINALTGGIVGTRNIKILVNHDCPCNHNAEHHKNK